MSVKVESEEIKTEEIIDDISTQEPKLNEDKLAALKAKMAAQTAASQPVPEPEEVKEEMVVKILEKKSRSLEFGVIGSGQAGSRIAESMYALGYPAVVVNTASVDLKNIAVPEANKILLDYGLGGASKDQNLGHEAAQAHKDLIAATVSEQLDDCHVFVFCTSLGGGSGGGSIETMIEVMSSLGKPVIMITVLPKASEDPQTKHNALQALSKLTTFIKSGQVHNLIVVDNAKIQNIYNDVSPMEFFKVSNQAIVEPLDIFNTYSSMDSDVKGIDQTEMAKILIDGGGLSLYGSMTVDNWEDETALAEAVVLNLTSGLLAEGFNLKQTKYVGMMFLAPKRVWDKLPSASIDYAMTMVQEHAGTALSFQGIYEADFEEDVVKVYSMFTGLALPESRVNELKAEVAAQAKVLKAKDEKRTLDLTVDTGESKALSDAEKIKNKIKAKSSPFGKFNKGVVDKRK